MEKEIERLQVLMDEFQALLNKFDAILEREMKPYSEDDRMFAHIQEVDTRKQDDDNFFNQ